MRAFFQRRNLHLTISSLIVIPAAFMYGLDPEMILPQVLDINTFTVDLKNVFRAVMCLYLGLAGIWILGIVNTSYWRSSTLLLIVFMACLAFGRILSVILDGQPSVLFGLGIFGELLLGGFAYWQLKLFKE